MTLLPHTPKLIQELSARFWRAHGKAEDYATVRQYFERMVNEHGPRRVALATTWAIDCKGLPTAPATAKEFHRDFLAIEERVW
jgi:hypothetical protein